jgi:DNA-binding SARP family transcriptional activator
MDPDAVLEADGESIGIRPTAVQSLDVVTFERCTDGPDLWRRGGDPPIRRRTSPKASAHDCFAAERERLSDRFEDALALAATTRLAGGERRGGRGWRPEQLILRDPLREEAHAVMIAIHGLVGSRSQVVRQYRRVQEVLARELDVLPLPETDATYRVALARTVERSRERAATLEPKPVPLAVIGR